MMFYISGGKIVNENDKPGRSGIDVHYVKSREVLYIGGWYDSCAGIESAEIPLSSFLKKLGVTKKTLSRIQKEWENES